MLSEMSSSLFSEWMAFAQLEPFGFRSDMYGHAITASTIANVNRRKGKKPFSPNDFIPTERKRQSGDTFIQSLKTFFGLNKEDK